jgi:hypothetical protein
VPFLAELLNHGQHSLAFAQRRAGFTINNDLIPGPVPVIQPRLLLLLILFSDLHLIVGRLSERDYLLDIKVVLAVDLVRDKANSTDVYAVKPVQPQNTRGDLAGEVTRDKHDADVCRDFSLAEV